MSALLLDTHALVWLVAGSQRLGSRARNEIQRAAQQDRLFVSAISPWEIATLVSKRRLLFDRDVGEWLQAALALPGIHLEPLSVEVAVASTRLPGDFHADPADRIIVATARHLGATVVTDDEFLLDYSGAGHVRSRRAGH